MEEPRIKKRESITTIGAIAIFQRLEIKAIAIAPKSAAKILSNAGAKSVEDAITSARPEITKKTTPTRRITLVTSALVATAKVETISPSSLEGSTSAF